MRGKKQKIKKTKIINRLFFNLKINQINSFLVFIYLVFLPTQLGKHFFLSFSYLNGIRVDYLAPTLYFNDLIFLGLFLLNIKLVLKYKKVFFLLLIFFFLNFFSSLVKIISFYYGIRICQWLIIFYILKEKPPPPKKILFAFLIISFIEFFLSFYQFYFGKSFQSIFYFLGERSFSLSTPSIAKGFLFGKEFLRPYGTFSHPNSLAGFYLLLYFFVLTSKKFNKLTLLKNTSLILFSFLIFISFSKIAIFIFIFLNLIYFTLKIKKCYLCLVAKILVFFVLGLIFFNVRGDILSLEKRLLLLNNSLLIFLKYPLGVGLGNYLIAQIQIPAKIYLFFNQPVHNLFLLSLNELGIFLWVFFWYLLIKKVKILNLNHYLLTVIFISSFFDHYWLTAYQNFFLMGVIFALI